MTTLDPLTKSPNLGGQVVVAATALLMEFDRLRKDHADEMLEPVPEDPPVFAALRAAIAGRATDGEPGYTEDEIGAATADVGLPDSICERLLIALQDARAKG